MKKHTPLLIASLVLTTLMLLTGCLKDDGNNTEYPDVTATADTIFGILKYKHSSAGSYTVTDWPFGTATFKAITGSTDILASATVNADGSFMLILPAKIKGSYLSSLANVATIQGGTLKVVPETVLIMSSILYKLTIMITVLLKLLLPTFIH
jgi:hypothetical protein